jgi:SAM-dependent methyltransferase
VLAVDQDISAVTKVVQEQGLAATLLEIDLESASGFPSQSSFDVIVVSNYLFRPRLALLMRLLVPGGMLVAETFAMGNEAFGKPSRPDFLLTPHELLDRVRSAGLVVHGFEQGFVDQPKPAITQRIAACRPQ